MVEKSEIASVLKQESVNILVLEDGGFFIAKCLDIPGCASQGKTRDEALANIHEAIAMCLDIIRQDVDLNPESHPKAEIIKYSIEDLIHA